MKRSDRIALIRKVCSRLADLEWHDLDLTLRQFGLPWTDQWAGDKYSYCIRNVEEASDVVLGELHEHLFDGKDFPGSLLDETGGPWASGCFHLFLSHLSRDKVFVSEVKQHLAKRAIDAFVAHEDIDPTKEWEKEIETGLATCDGLAALMTPGFHDSKWTDQEIGYCVRRRVLIIPVRMGVDPYGFIARYQALSGSGKSAEELAGGIFDVLCQHDLTSGAMARAIVSQFEDSASFAAAKANAVLLRRVTQWSPDLLQRVEQAVERNGQIESAWGVPDSVRSLIAQHSQ
jgi:hypothetical protein